MYELVEEENSTEYRGTEKTQKHPERETDRDTGSLIDINTENIDYN